MKRPSTSANPQIAGMLARARCCLSCGAPIVHKRCRGYCSRECYRHTPPRLAYACQAWGMAPADLLKRVRLSTQTADAAAGLLGVSRPCFYRWLALYGLAGHRKGLTG